MSTTLTRSVGLNRIAQMLRGRWYWIPIGMLIAGVASAVYAFATPLTWEVTSVVQITTVDETFASRTNAADASEMEHRIVRSERNLTAAAEALGDGWTAAELRDGLTVAKDPTGYIVEITFSADDPDQAVLAADAIADAYLENRADLFAERVEARAATLDQRIADTNAQLAGPISEATAEALTVALEDLTSERATLPDPTAPTGIVLTPSDARPAWGSMDRSNVIFAGTAAGAVFGLFLLLLAQGAGRRPVSPHDYVASTGAPVFVADSGAAPWARTATLLNASSGTAPITVLAHQPDLAADELVSAISSQQEVELVDAGAADALAQVKNRFAVLAADRTWSRAELARWADDLDMLDVGLVGVALLNGGKNK